MPVSYTHLDVYKRQITDRKGAFSLEVPANAILRCSYQGRESQEVLAADMTNNTHLSLSSKSREMNEQVFTVVEKMPSFPGGDAELLKYIATNIKYPNCLLYTSIRQRN